MKRLEAFSLGKKFDNPDANEDSFVAIPGVGYAVIDGVTDRNGTRYNGMLSGQYASRLIKRAVEEFFLALGDTNASKNMRYSGPVDFIDYLTNRLHQGYVDTGMIDAATADWKLRAGCTLMAAFEFEGKLEIVAVGDSGIRVNGSDILQILKPLDDVMGILRRETWNYFAEKGVEASKCDALAASLTWPGTKNQTENQGIDPQTIETIERRALAACTELLPKIPQSEFLELLQQGIANGQGNFQNVDDRDLGYGGLDGFAIPDKYIDTCSYDMKTIHTLELFTDGYFKLGDGFGIEAWEKGFREVETVDPYKIGDYMSTKGTTELMLTDDRTYLGVQLK